MDSTASSLSMDNDIPLLVFNLNEHGNIRRAILGENIGTTVRGNKMADAIMTEAKKNEKQHKIFNVNLGKSAQAVRTLAFWTVLL